MGGQIDGDVFVGELLLELTDELVDDLFHDGGREFVEGDDFGESISEFRTEQAFDFFESVGDIDTLFEPNSFAAHVPGTRVARHDEDHIAEVRFPAVVIRQRGTVHDLQENIEEVHVGLFEFVEQQHGMRCFAYGAGEQSALIESDIARWRADQSRNRVFFHIFAHVVAKKTNAEQGSELTRDLRFSHACGSDE